jgi:hypothetical protein
MSQMMKVRRKENRRREEMAATEKVEAKSKTLNRNVHGES